MANIAFFPHPEFGHLNPPLKLARGLREAGHSVYYIGLPDFEDYIRSQGLAYACIMEKRFPKGYLQRSVRHKAELDLDNLALIVSAAAGLHGEMPFDLYGELESGLRGVLTTRATDLLIIDFKLRELAGILAAKVSIPIAILSVTLIDLAPLTDPAENAGGAGHFPELFLCPKEFDFPSTVKVNRYYIEPSIELGRREVGAFPWHALDANRRLIYCSLGSQPQQYRESVTLFRCLIAAVARRPDLQLVVAVGAYGNPQEYQPKTSNVIVVNWAPQLELLQRAEIMVTHGGLGAVKECIFFGVPMIVFPFRWDQPHNAARVAYHGLGMRGEVTDISTHEIDRLIETVSENVYFRRRINEMRKVFRAVENSGIGIETIEKIMNGHRDKRTPVVQSASVPGGSTIEELSRK